MFYQDQILVSKVTKRSSKDVVYVKVVGIDRLGTE
jgi:hypothetical protein